MPLSCSPSPCAVKLPAFGACPLSVDRRLTRLWATGYGWGAGTQAASEGGRGTVAGVTARLRRKAATARRDRFEAAWRDPPTPRSGYGAAKQRAALARHLLPGGVEARKRQRNEGEIGKRSEFRDQKSGGLESVPAKHAKCAKAWRRTVGGKVFRPPPLAAPAACDVRFVTGGTRRARERATCRRHRGPAGTIRTAVTRRQGKRAGRPRSQATLPHADRETRRRNGGLHH